MNEITIPWSHSQYHAHIHFTVLLWITSHLQFWSESQYHHHIQLKVWLCLTSHLQTRSVSHYNNCVHFNTLLCLVDYLLSAVQVRITIPWSCSFKGVIVSCGLPVICRSGQYHTTTIVFTLTRYCVLWITCRLQFRSVSHYNDCVHFNKLLSLVDYLSSADQVSITLQRLCSL